MTKRPWAVVMFGASAALLAATFAGCGSDNGVTIDDGDGGDEGGDASTSSDGSGKGNIDGSSANNKDGGGSNDAGAIKDGSNFFEGGVIPDASRAESGVCANQGDNCVISSDCCTANCDKATLKCAAPITKCKAPGASCLSGLDCCTGSCPGGTCSSLACVQDKGVCAANTDCCSGSCAPNAMGGGGTCAPLPTAGGCKTINNSCNTSADCCSSFCNNGSCAAPSYCGQIGDTCGTPNDCCGGICTIVGGAALGLCNAPTKPPATPNCTIDGQLCGGAYDGGALPTCGGVCCSKSCKPFTTGFLICQPASGCKPTGEVCMADGDCCGSANLPFGGTTNVVCSGATATTPGRCANGNTCSPPGNVCKLNTTSCSTSAVCCGIKPNGNPGGLDTSTHPLICQQDNLGIPRCLATSTLDCTATDAGSLAGTLCATSADCCGDPCVSNGAGQLVCSGSACIDNGGVCSNTADCCAGLPCTMDPGSTKGLCGGILLADGGILPPPPDAGSGGTDAGADGGSGAICSRYGQVCFNTPDCCTINGAQIPCTGGRCLLP